MGDPTTEKGLSVTASPRMSILVPENLLKFGPIGVSEIKLKSPPQPCAQTCGACVFI